MRAVEDGADSDGVRVSDGEDGDRRVAERSEAALARGALTNMDDFLSSWANQEDEEEEEEEEEGAVIAVEPGEVGRVVGNAVRGSQVANNSSIHTPNCDVVNIGPQVNLTLVCNGEATRHGPAESVLGALAARLEKSGAPPIDRQSSEGSKNAAIHDNEKNSDLELSRAKKILTQVVPSSTAGRTIWALFIMFFVAAVTALVAITVPSSATPDPPSVDDDGIVTRQGWGAQARRCTPNPLATPVRYVVISHTVTPNCFDKKSCSERARNIQADHQNRDDIECDIGFNFLVGGDGRAYEGRGWRIRGAHTYGFNSRSIGIAFVGDFTQVHPTEEALRRAQDLLEEGVRRGALLPSYKVLGQRQVFATVSPGDALYSDIKKWAAWASEP